jgi:Lrp/AsnC family transcriptional regulator, leucine-responsive regulatory protein
MRMDAIDIAILDALKQNARASASEIGKRVSLSVPAAAERIRKLERAGIIAGYTVRVDREKTGHALLAFLLVRVGGTENVKAFRKEIVRHDCVLECHHVTGAYDYLLKVAAEDVRALESFISGTLKGVKGVLDTNTMISLHTLKEEINP